MAVNVAVDSCEAAELEGEGKKNCWYEKIDRFYGGVRRDV